MVDNVKYAEPGAGTLIHTDDIGGGVQVQRVKVGQGDDGTYVDVYSGGPLYATLGARADVVGWDSYFNGSLSNTDDEIKSSIGVVGGMIFGSLDADTVFVQFHDAATVTEGSDPPLFAIPLEAGDGAGDYSVFVFAMSVPIQFTTRISLFAATTATGSTAPTNPVVATVFYK